MVVEARRAFQSLAEFNQWRADVEKSRLRLQGRYQPKLLETAKAAPFLYSVFPMADQVKISGTKNHSLLECLYPLTSNELLRTSVTDFNNWSSFRLGKFYEIVDALTADVGYRHCESMNRNGQEVSMVTAGHYQSRKFHRTDIRKDVILRSYVTSVGKSSMEVRTDVVQYNDERNDEILVNVCHTVMVALDHKTGKSIGKIGKSLPPLQRLEDPGEELRLKLAVQNSEIRHKRASEAMNLRAKVSKPPSSTEMEEIHKLHISQTLLRESEAASMREYYRQLAPKVSDFTFRSSTVIFPEKRNAHGKTFGGFVMDEAQKLAQYAATLLSKGNPIIPLGIDEAVFLQPISIGDLVTFTARCVHSTGYCCRILVTVEVRDPKHRDKTPSRRNRCIFVFGGNSFPEPIVPYSYQEILMHIDAQRRFRVEGPTEEEVAEILANSLFIVN